MSEKLQKILARTGHGSRRELEKVIADGRVSINGKVAKLGDRAEETDLLRLDGHVIKTQSDAEKICRVLVYNKQEGELCSRSDPENRETVFDRLPQIKGARWIAVGRLDVNTSGLLLFTTDGELANRLMHPSHEVQREYAVRVFGEVDDSMLSRLRKGVELEDGSASFKGIRPLDRHDDESINRWFKVIITEGRNREVRRLWESQGVQVSRLIRTKYGDIELGKALPRGGWQELRLKQVNYLRKLVELKPESETKLDVTNPKTNTRTQTARIRRAVKKHKLKRQQRSRHST